MSANRERLRSFAAVIGGLLIGVLVGCAVSRPQESKGVEPAPSLSRLGENEFAVVYLNDVKNNTFVLRNVVVSNPENQRKVEVVKGVDLRKELNRAEATLLLRSKNPTCYVIHNNVQFWYPC